MRKRSPPTINRFGEPTTKTRSVHQIARDALAFSQTPLYRNAAALILSTGINGVLGLVFWALAARLYTAEEVGRGAASIAALLLVSMLGCNGVTSALIRFIPGIGPGTLRLVRTAYIVSLTVALVCGAGFLLATQLFIEPLSVHGLVYLAAVGIWVIFTLEDGVLIGLRRTGWVPVENTFFALIKIALLVALSSTGGAWAIFVSWSIASAILVVPVNLALFLKFIPFHMKSSERRKDEFELADIGRFTIGNHVSGLLMALPDFLMPIIVLQIEGAHATAYFYAAWSLVFPLRLIATNIANALTAEAAVDERQLEHLWQRAGTLTAAVFLPLIVVLTLGSHPILKMLFGVEYAANGEVLMRILAIALIPFAFTSLYIAVARVRRQVRRLIVLAIVSSGLSLTLSITLIWAIGIDGAGIAWLAGQAAVAVAAFAIWSFRLFETQSRMSLVENSATDPGV